eukprot:m.25461 g.25461  ORF g.25461 m.25461 type:complete len:577 (+) comp8861_c1_seq1:2083-3813(+)
MAAASHPSPAAHGVSEKVVLYQQPVSIETQLGRSERRPGQLIFFTESPDNSNDMVISFEPRDSSAAIYAFQHHVREIQTVVLKGYMMFVTLKSGIASPPVTAEHGFRDVLRFLQQHNVIEKVEIGTSFDRSLEALGLVKQMVFNTVYAERASLSSSLHGARVKCTATKTLGDLGTFDVLTDNASRLAGQTATGLPAAWVSYYANEEMPEPVGEDEWRAFFDSTGECVDKAALLEMVFFRGVEPPLRRDAFDFLLGYTNEPEFRAQRRADYAAMKLQWSSLLPVQLARSVKLRDLANRVEKDVDRTDRELDFFAGSSPNLVLLHDMLMTYAQLNFDLGYVQGMSDLAAIALTLTCDEVDAFWLFTGIMDRYEKFFWEEMTEMKEYLRKLGRLLRFLDPDLMEHLDRNESGGMFFCFRWILILFKREFRIEHLWNIWLSLFTNFLSEEYFLFIAVAMLTIHRKQLLELNFEGILKYVNELSYHIDAARVQRHAFALWQRLFDRPEDVPEELVCLGGVWLAERIKVIQRRKEEAAAQVAAEKLARQRLEEEQEAQRARAASRVKTGPLVEGDWMTLDVD